MNGSSASFPRRAFTLIEMLVVIVILGILVALVIGLAARVTTGGKFGATKNAIETFDSMANEFATFKGGQPPAWVKTKLTQTVTLPPGGLDDPGADQIAPEEYIFPIIDGRYDARVIPPSPAGNSPRFDRDLDPAQPSGALFLLVAAESTEVARLLKGLDAKFVQKRDVLAYGWRVDANTGLPTGTIVQRRLRIPVPMDAFGYPIRVVHPEFHGGSGTYFIPNATGWTAGTPARAPIQVRPFWEARQAPAPSSPQPSQALFTRSFRPFNPDTVGGSVVGDADEGSCVGNSIYFYSVGSDGDPGTRSDNVYTTQPAFPAINNRVN